MSELELQNKDKTVAKMTRDGLYEENITQGTSTRVSERKEDYDLDKADTEVKQEYRREQFLHNSHDKEEKEEGSSKSKTSKSNGEKKGEKSADGSEIRVIARKKGKEQSNNKREKEKAAKDTEKAKSSKNEEIKYSKKTQKAFVRVSKAENRRDRRFAKIPKKKRLCFENEKTRTTKGLENVNLKKNRLKFENKTNRKGEIVFDTSYKKKKAAVRKVKREIARKAKNEFFEEEENNLGIKGTHFVYRRVRNSKRVVSRMARSRMDPINRYKRSVKKLGKRSSKAEYLRFLDENVNKDLHVKGIFKKRLQKRRYKKKFAEAYKKTNNAAYAASYAQASVVKASRKIAETIAKVRKIMFAGGASGFLIILLMLLIFFLVMAVVEFVSIISTAGVAGMYPGENVALTDTDGYYTEKEADLDNEIKHMEEQHPGYDEYQYHLDNIEHDQVALLSYLSVMFEDFTLVQVQPELDSIFAEQYELELREEMQTREREVEVTNIITGETEIKIETYEYWILHVTLTNHDFKNILLNRLTDDDMRERFEIYLETGGARQVFGNPFDFDWSGDISSPFGWRIHPITHEKKFHTGVDIAEPKGTPIKAVMSGNVVISRYSDSAGNYIAIQDKDGYMTKYMHCSELFVSEGAQVLKGDVIAAVGTTGNSTGNHLHLDVIDPSGNYLNPVLMVATSNMIKEE